MKKLEKTKTGLKKVNEAAKQAWRLADDPNYKRFRKASEQITKTFDSGEFDDRNVTRIVINYETRKITFYGDE